MPNLGTKNSLFRYFWVKLSKKLILPFSTSAPSNLSSNTMSKFGKKNALFGKFWAIIWKENYCHIEISNLKVFKLNNLTKIQKCLNLGRKISYFGIYGLDFLKRLLYLKLPLPNLSKFEILAKEKTEISEFWTKTSLFWYLLVRLLKKPMFCFLKSEPSNFSDLKILENFKNKGAQICLNTKLCQILKCQNSETKTLYLRIFQLEF